MYFSNNTKMNMSCHNRNYFSPKSGLPFGVAIVTGGAIKLVFLHSIISMRHNV
jgi:hypothetical protein